MVEGRVGDVPLPGSAALVRQRDGGHEVEGQRRSEAAHQQRVGQQRERRRVARRQHVEAEPAGHGSGSVATLTTVHLRR